MTISIVHLIGCDICGSSEGLNYGRSICDRCIERLRPKWEKERREAVSAFMSNHPNLPLPSCFLPETVKTEHGSIFKLSEDKTFYSNSEREYLASNLRFSSVTTGVMDADEIKFEVIEYVCGFATPCLSPEDRAIALSQNEEALRKHLIEKALALKEVYRVYFPSNECKLDFPNKRLLGINGYVLQWKLRPQPQEPESYRNQQTSLGCVELLKVGELSKQEATELMKRQLDNFTNI